MATHGGVETEFKWRVADEAELEAVAAAAGAAARATATQENHFFDTEDRALGASGWALRLREEDGRYFLTAKGPRRAPDEAAVGAAPVTRTEVEVELRADVAGAILAGERDPLAELSAASRGAVDELVPLVGSSVLRHLGAFRNRRTRIGPVSLPGAAGPVEVVLELDRTEFPGDVVHCELEVEVQPSRARAAGEALGALLDRAGVVGRSAPSKAERFFRALAGEAID